MMLYGCETWSLTLRFDIWTEEILSDRKCRKLHEELHNLYSSSNIITMIRERVARMGAKRNEYRILVGKPDGKRPLGRPRRR
jgi:hypothetical protein